MRCNLFTDKIFFFFFQPEWKAYLSDTSDTIRIYLRFEVVKVGAMSTNSCQNIKYGYPAKYFIILRKKNHPKCGGFLKEILFSGKYFYFFIYSFYFIKFEKYLDIFFWKFSLKIDPTLIMEHTEEERSGY